MYAKNYLFQKATPEYASLILIWGFPVVCCRLLLYDVKMTSRTQ